MLQVDAGDLEKDLEEMVDAEEKNNVPKTTDPPLRRLRSKTPGSSPKHGVVRVFVDLQTCPHH